jgi:hypothetical protein
MSLRAEDQGEIDPRTRVGWAFPDILRAAHTPPAFQLLVAPSCRTLAVH